MFSVTSDIQAGQVLKSAAPKPSRQDAAQPSDSFSALVDAATPPDPSTSSLPPTASTPRASNAASPSRETTRTSDTDRTSQTRSADKAQDNTDDGTSRTERTGSDAPSDTTTDTSAKSTTDTADASDGKSSDKKDGDQAGTDATTAAAAAGQAPVPTPAAVAIPSEITLADAATAAPASDGEGASTAPVPTAPVGTTGSGPKSTIDASAGLMAAAAKAAGAAKTTEDAASTSAPETATASGDAAASTDQTFTAALDATVPGGPKATGKPGAQVKTGLAPGEIGKTSEQSAPATQGTQPQAQGTDPGQQPTVAAKPDGGEVEPLAKGGNGPAQAAHERGAAHASGQGNVPVADPTAPATAALQPQLSTPTASTSPITSANLTATAATSAPVPLHGLAVEIAASALNGKSRFEIRLDPAELGRIDVRIDVDRNGQVTSHLRVEKPETLAMLQQTAPQLQQALQDAGLKSNNSGLQFSLRDQNSSGQNGGDYQQNGNSQRLIVTEDENVPVQLAGRSYGRMFGAQGGVDIRV
ncbi:flagellar hook-length control protein FliK [Bradyrhizobium sp. 83002]|uniref:flagellar hook-length control protein FliK n=1 Tax=Bradyrhizobium aeschynomenes TaxID=2734909 RepID=UPI00155211A8|nr:flagellar hook-length control protein FliK [Bradyrhizobium aeschynomenes]NPU11346.1 flagellar hook-length control protein FliK [Bradyrhizobium aeschynomenes]